MFCFFLFDFLWIPYSMDYGILESILGSRKLAPRHQESCQVDVVGRDSTGLAFHALVGDFQNMLARALRKVCKPDM